MKMEEEEGRQNGGGRERGAASGQREGPSKDREALGRGSPRKN